MKRKRTVLAATAVSLVLTAGSTAFALANGVFVTQPVDRVGSFQAIEARLVPETKAVHAPTSISAPPPDKETPAAATGSAGTGGPNSQQSDASSTPSLTGATGGPTSEPTTEPSDDSSHESTDESHEPSSSSTSTPTSVPQVNSPGTTTTIAHSAPSTVPTEPGDDAPSAPGGESDD